MRAYEKIARILRADKDTIRVIEEKLGGLTGKKDVMDKIIEENEAMIKNRLAALGLKREATAKEVYTALINKIKNDDNLLFSTLDRPHCGNISDCNRILEVIKRVASRPKGFFLKKEKAIELLKNQPPPNIIRSLGYSNVGEMLQKEDLFEVFSALRFLEDNQWLQDTFFKQYENLKPSDFEEREITLKTLGYKWAAAAESFVKKKYHNISHLKELGVVFVIPIALGFPGELTRMISLVLHYVNEIPFYSGLFKKFAENEEIFAKNLISLLRGDVIDERLKPSKKSQWLVIQRYLAKDDENDWRLFEPHINPEVIHWRRAEHMIVKAGEMFDTLAVNLSFWQNLNWVGDYFGTETGIDVLVSFNLIDTVMSLVKEKELIKYLYHHQESLWNKIFSEYLGAEKIEEMIKENIIKGWLEV
jgi:hypothetical protein